VFAVQFGRPLRPSPRCRSAAECPAAGRAVCCYWPAVLSGLSPEWIRMVVGDRPAWRHDPSGVAFRLVPGGTFQMGLPDPEVAALRAIAARGKPMTASRRRCSTSIQCVRFAR
jgi:hypothetical protein